MSLLTETIYDAAVDPPGWARVVDLLIYEFASPAGALYCLHGARRAMHAVQITGIGERYLRCFNDCYFTQDNPWTRSDPLHRIGVVRTDARLAAFFRDPQVLRRSQYYNDWMRPQRFDHTLGTTLLSEGGMIANLTLLRGRDRGAFAGDEVRRFETLCGHLTRALRIGWRVETALSAGNAAEALDSLALGIALLDQQGRVLHLNAAAEALAQRGDGLAVRAGRLVAVDDAAQRALLALLRRAVPGRAAEDSPSAADFAIVPRKQGVALTLSAIPLSSQRHLLRGTQPVILLTIADPSAPHRHAVEHARRRYGLTPAESRLTACLLSGKGLRAIAQELGIRYETARSCLKVLFHKTDTQRQSELVLRLLGQSQFR